MAPSFVVLISFSVNLSIALQYLLLIKILYDISMHRITFKQQLTNEVNTFL
jgi:hypothetical protein